MGKYVNEKGQVAILVSPGFGAGWSTWNTSGAPGWYATDKGLVELKLNNAAEDDVLKYCKEAINDEPYMGGWEDVVIEWLESGTKFSIHDYDGNESLRLIEDLSMTA